MDYQDTFKVMRGTQDPYDNFIKEASDTKLGEPLSYKDTFDLIKAGREFTSPSLSEVASRDLSFSQDITNIKDPVPPSQFRPSTFESKDSSLTEADLQQHLNVNPGEQDYITRRFQHFLDVIKFPSKVYQKGASTEEMIPWASDVALQNVTSNMKAGAMRQFKNSRRKMDDKRSLPPVLRTSEDTSPPAPANENIPLADRLPPPLSRMERDWQNYGSKMSPDEVLQSEPVWGAAQLGKENGTGEAKSFADMANFFWQRMGANRFISEEQAAKILRAQRIKDLGIREIKS